MTEGDLSDSSCCSTVVEQHNFSRADPLPATAGSRFCGITQLDRKLRSVDQ